MEQEEIISLFSILKMPSDMISVEFPGSGQKIEIELENESGRIKFQADINRHHSIIEKPTFQLRHQKTYAIRRLDIAGGHRNPPGPAPDDIFNGYENYQFIKEDHVHFYITGYDSRWALPLAKLPEIGITDEDDLYERMIKFFQYCNVKDLELKVKKNLLL